MVFCLKRFPSVSVFHRVPVWGPYFFLYMLQNYLMYVIESHLPEVHCFADDTQLYISFEAGGAKSQDEAVVTMYSCIHDLRTWMLQDKLKLYDDKTEFLVIDSKQQLSELHTCSIRVGNTDVYPVDHVRNLGSRFDSNMSMSTHISKLSSTAFFYLHNIRRIRKFLDRKSLITLVHAFVSNRLNYCNSLLYGLPNTEICMLQRVQNTAARLIHNSSKFAHVTPVLYELHWLLVRSCISLKVLLIVFKNLLRRSPLYISDLISVRKTSSYGVRSNAGLLLDFPPMVGRYYLHC